MQIDIKEATAGLAPLDAELQWVATELASMHVEKRRAANRQVQVGELPTAYCPTIADLVADRLGATLSSNRLSAAEASLIGANSLASLDPEQKLGFTARVELAARFVVAASKIRAISPVSHEGLRADYWPFGMAGGFCNPNKLNEMTA
ncbi:hypothetical protein [Burkholderia cenocepacia]|uniref:hypothetical protein n=1 Tax=Burkholderia cenocepacia TaxID=95486 RepID=UPI0007619344|nr:hypothetical protein [Burkholderia cenocepacia]KWU23405.1 hypothetical protein AS149_37080 [Burkholderia cenocepacia]